MTPGCPPVDRVRFQRLKLLYDRPLSNFAFKFNLRRYIMAVDAGEALSSLPDWLSLTVNGTAVAMPYGAFDGDRLAGAYTRPLFGSALVHFSAQPKPFLVIDPAHFSAQPEPFLVMDPTHRHRVPTKRAYVEPKSGRV